MVADIRFILYSVVWLSVWSGTLLYIFLDSNILYTWPVHPVSRILRLVFGFEIYSHLNYIPNFFTWNIIEVVQWHYSLYLYIRSSMFPYNVLIVFFLLQENGVREENGHRPRMHERQAMPREEVSYIHQSSWAVRVSRIFSMLNQIYGL